MSDDEEHREVVVLGAGFSRAINPLMPTADHLGEMACQLATDMERLPISFSAEYPFETWLSLLAEDQPYLHEAENRDNAALFARLRDAIVNALEGAQVDAMSSPAPGWFSQLLSAWHYKQTTVISLNYDTLIETGVASRYLDRSGSGGDRIGTGFSYASPSPDAFQTPVPAPAVLADDLLRSLPMTQRSSEPQLWSPAATLRLLKLHGSLDWWWVPNDQTGATLVRYDTGSTFGYPQVLTPDQHGRDLPGRERFIIPPLATKSPYYRNPITRQLWQDAFDVLRRAHRISLIGYSLPQTDIVMSGLLEGAIRGREVEIDIINCSPEGPVSRLAALGGPRTPRVFNGDHCVADYAGLMCEEASATVAREVAGLADRFGDESPASVVWSRWGERIDRRVSHIEDGEDGSLIVETDDELLFQSTMREGQPSARAVAQSANRAKRIVTTTKDQKTSALAVGYTTARLDDPNAIHWLTLHSAGELTE